MQRKKIEPEIAPSGETENPPVYIPDEDLYIPDDGITVPTDSTETPPQESSKDDLAALLAEKVVSVTEITYEGRGLRLYLGKPTLATFEDMLRQSHGDGIVIEPDPRHDDLHFTIWKERK